MNKDSDLKEKIIKALSDHLGVEPSDIDEEDSILHDLHMSTLELSDFCANLQNLGVNSDNIDLNSVDTVSDLIDLLGGETKNE